MANVNYKAIIVELTGGASSTIPKEADGRWVAFALETTGGTCTVQDADGNTCTIADGGTLSYGSPDNAKSFDTWTVTAGAGATVNIVYNQ